MPIIERTPLAKEDLFDIWYYIAVENASRLNADRFISKLDKEFLKLAKSSMMGTDRSIYAPNLRGWPFGKIYDILPSNSQRNKNNPRDPW